MEWIFLVGWYYIYISIPETSKWSNFERGIIGLSKKHLPFFHFDEGWGWMSLLKTSLKKKKLLITIILSCWGWCLKSPPFLGITPFPRTPQKTKWPRSSSFLPWLCSLLVDGVGSEMPLTEPPSKDGKKKTSTLQVGISKWSKILLATAAYHNFDFCKGVSIICLAKNNSM